MPSKDPSVLQMLLELFTPEVKASVMAVVISVLRVIYDRKESSWQRILLEGALCGALAYGLSSGLTFFDIDKGLAVFAGGMIGLFGVEFVRARARRFVDKRESRAD